MHDRGQGSEVGVSGVGPGKNSGELSLADLTAMHESRGDMHEVLLVELTAESIDRSALEAMRAEKMAKLEVASLRVVDAVASVGEILSQDQRLELVEEAMKHHDRRDRVHGWHRD